MVATKKLLILLIVYCSVQAGIQGSSAIQYTPFSPEHFTREHLTQDRVFPRNGTADSCGTYTNCPVWTECIGNKCVCTKEFQKYNKMVRCDKETLQLSVSMCNCVTYESSSEEVVTGMCLETCYEPQYLDLVYLPLPLNDSEMNQFICGEKWNRTGRLCGKCLPGHSPLAYSYDMRCVKCPEGNRNVWKYILVAFGPLTIFYIVALFLKINVTSSYLHGYLLFAQIISSPVYTRNIAVFLNNNTEINQIVLQVVGTLYGIWNLDFFRGLYPGLCLDLSTLTILALDYAVATYPLLLTVVSYFLIELHAKNFRVMIVLWKPFGYLCKFFHKNWDGRTTIIDAFTTFFVLSFSKIAWTSLDLLTPVAVHSLTSDTTKKGFFYNGTVEYFGSNHLPYAILALVFSLVFVITPTMLLLCYQVKWVQRRLSCLNAQSQLLQAVMDSVQGHYKDGTEEGTKDRRWFAAVPLIGRFSVFFTYVLTLDISTSAAPAITIVVFMIVLMALLQPYKNRFARYTKIDIFFWGLLAILFCILQGNFSKWLPLSILSNFLIPIVLIFTALLMACLSVYWILSRMQIVKKLISQIKAWRKGYMNIETDPEEVLPDRVANPGNYMYEEQNLQDPVTDDRSDRDNDTY